MWYMANPHEFGYKEPPIPPQRPGEPPVDYNKIIDEATAKFLKDNGDKIRLKRYVEK